MYDYSGMTVLITGASRGIGAELAREVARRGAASLVLVARDEDQLRQLANELTAAHQTRVEVIALDLSREDAPQALKAETDRRNLTIDILVNNAGFGSYGPFADLAPEREQAMVNLNVRALVELTNRFLPSMIARNRGGVLNVSSTAAFQPVPYMATYGATKAFVQSFTEAIWAENQDKDSNLHVTALCPGRTESHFAEHLEAGQGLFENAPQMSAVDVARIGWDGWERNAAFVVAGAANYVGTLTPRLFPRPLVARVSARIFRPADLATKEPSRTRTLILGTAALGTLLASTAFLRARRRS